MFLKLIWLIPTLPLLSATILGIFGRRFKLSERTIALIACGTVFVSLILTFGAVYQYGASERAETGQPYLSSEAGGFPNSFTWVPGGAAEVSLGPDAEKPAS